MKKHHIANVLTALAAATAAGPFAFALLPPAGAVAAVAATALVVLLLLSAADVAAS